MHKSCLVTGRTALSEKNITQHGRTGLTKISKDEKATLTNAFSGCLKQYKNAAWLWFYFFKRKQHFLLGCRCRESNTNYCFCCDREQVSVLVSQIIYLHWTQHEKYKADQLPATSVQHACIRKKYARIEFCWLLLYITAKFVALFILRINAIIISQLAFMAAWTRHCYIKKLN